MQEFEKVAAELEAAEDELKKNNALVGSLKAKLDEMAGNKRKIEGSLHLTGEFYKVVVSRKIKREFNPKRYLELKGGIPENFDPITERGIHDKQRYKVSLKDLRMLEKIDPNLVSEIITTKPATSTVAVKRVDKDES